MRTLSGEWVVNKSVWKRLRTEAREREVERKKRKRERSQSAEGVSTSRLGEGAGVGEGLRLDVEAATAGVKGKKEEKVIYYIHGGECQLRLSSLDDASSG